MFLRIQGNGGLSGIYLWGTLRVVWAYFRLPLDRIASINFKCVTYNDLTTGHCEPGYSIVHTRSLP